MNKTDLRLCGLKAVRARFQRAPETIVRLFFDEGTAPKVGEICRVLAQTKRVYRLVTGDELEKIGGTIHHGGVVAVVYQEPLREVTQKDFERWAMHREPLLLLDRIGNAHNLGALARTAAFYGVKHIVLQADTLTARPHDAAYRIAEGGLEHVTVWVVQVLPKLVEALDDVGYEVVGAATRGACRLWASPVRRWRSCWATKSTASRRNWRACARVWSRCPAAARWSRSTFRWRGLFCWIGCWRGQGDEEAQVL